MDWHLSARWKECIDLDGRAASPVLWTSAAPSKDRPELRRWGAAVGPVRAANTPGVARSWPLTVAVWNAQVGGGAIRSLWAQLVRERGPVILLLQEVFATGPHLPEAGPGAAWAPRIAGEPDNEHRTDIASFAREAGLSLLYVPSMRNGGPDGGLPEDRGNAILANVPLSSPRAIELPFERQRRVAVAATVTTEAGDIAFCSCHLDNRAPWRYMWRTAGVAPQTQDRRVAGYVSGVRRRGRTRPGRRLQYVGSRAPGGGVPTGPEAVPIPGHARPPAHPPPRDRRLAAAFGSPDVPLAARLARRIPPPRQHRRVGSLPAGGDAQPSVAQYPPRA